MDNVNNSYSNKIKYLISEPQYKFTGKPLEKELCSPQQYTISVVHAVELSINKVKCIQIKYCNLKLKDLIR